MPRPRKNSGSKTSNGATVGYEAQLWQMADALRGNMVDRTHRELTDGDIARIAGTYHSGQRLNRQGDLYAPGRGGCDPG